MRISAERRAQILADTTVRCRVCLVLVKRPRGMPRHVALQLCPTCSAVEEGREMGERFEGFEEDRSAQRGDETLRPKVLNS